ncbi:hypothetical protein [Paenarthrobacter nitroguajacolicus]|uniref:hypothetical protein n=1 Tax=Paenarthrobacter nitroguajacolicus TaxID=211146 RepID=UPI0015B87DF9|nr:hypothetical protein [Paenarthrobacter nitroguajacolicus]NWL35132.1 hypothetical protein [Paenarthrobacter nitroguajacolicus]
MGNYEPAHGINTTELWKRFEELESLPLKQFMEAFTRLAVRPDLVVQPPSAGAPPRWMAKRPAGVNAVLRDFEKYHLDHEQLSAPAKPVLYGVGGLSNPDPSRDIADRLSRVPRLLSTEFPTR